mgnify:CR=1 FL=1
MINFGFCGSVVFFISFVVVFTIVNTAFVTNSYAGERICIKAHRMPIRKLMSEIARDGDYLLFFEKNVGGSVSIKVDEKHPMLALDCIAKKCGLCIRPHLAFSANALAIDRRGSRTYPYKKLCVERYDANYIARLLFNVFGPEALCRVEVGAGFVVIFGDDKLFRRICFLASALDSRAGLFLQNSTSLVLYSFPPGTEQILKHYFPMAR